jgi:hypothetical protein
MRIDCSEYFRSHRIAPRGRGSWAFCDANYSCLQDYLAHTIFSPRMTYSEAKKWAIAHPKLEGAKTVALLP